MAEKKESVPTARGITLRIAVTLEESKRSGAARGNGNYESSLFVPGQVVWGQQVLPVDLPLVGIDWKNQDGRGPGGWN